MYMYMYFYAGKTLGVCSVVLHVVGLTSRVHAYRELMYVLV